MSDLFCEDCGQSFDEHGLGAICPECGGALLVERVRYCRHCDAELDEDGYCSECD